MADDAIKRNPAQRKRTIRRWFSRSGLALLAAGVVASIVSALLPKPVVVEMAIVQKGPLTVTVDDDGRTRVKDRYVISAPLAGSLARIDLHPGDRVEADGEVARLLPVPAPLLDPRSRAQAQAQLAAAEAATGQARSAESRARAALKFSESDAELQRKLAQGGAIPQQEVDRAELDLRTKKEDLSSATFGARVARHEVELARAALGRLGARGQSTDQMLLNSPVAGVVLLVLRENEGVVQAGTQLVEVGNPAALELVVDVLTSDAVRISKGAKARITRWGGGGELTGHVRRVEPKAFSRVSSLGVDEQRVNVVLDLDSPHEEWAALGDGFRIEASIAIWEQQDVVRLPVSAAFKHADKWTVFVVDGGRARLRHVEIGERNGFHAQILSGVQPGDRVILHPGERVSDGTEVKPR